SWSLSAAEPSSTADRLLAATSPPLRRGAGTPQNVLDHYLPGRTRRRPVRESVVPPGQDGGMGAEPEVLARFGPATRGWFEAAFAAPTAAQAGAWTAISEGGNALVVAPTGSGKTLAAFLWSLDRLAASPPPQDPARRCRVLYVSPLKALAVDVERNLRTPLTGIRQAAARLGLPPPDITVGMRT